MTRLCHLLSLRERIHQYKEHMVNLYVGGNCKYLAADMLFFSQMSTCTSLSWPFTAKPSDSWCPRLT